METTTAREDEAPMQLARQAALLMEPELRTLHGVLVALRHLGERADPIEPAAIAVLASMGETALAAVARMRCEMERGIQQAADTGG